MSPDDEEPVPSSVLDDLLTEGAQLQLRGLLGEAAGLEPPMFPGGLVPSTDGRLWIDPDQTLETPSEERGPEHDD